MKRRNNGITYKSQQDGSYIFYRDGKLIAVCDNNEFTETFEELKAEYEEE